MELQKPTKKRLLTTLLSVAMAFTMLPTAAFAQEPATDDGGPVTTCICESKCMKDLVNKECGVCKNDFDKCGDTGKAAPAESTAAAALRARINALPTAEEYMAMKYGKQEQVYNEAAAIDDTYNTLSEEEQAMLNIRKVGALLAMSSVNTYSLAEDTSKTPEQLVQSLIGDGVAATDIISTGTVYNLSDATELGMAAGAALDTSGKSPAAQDSDLAALISSEGKDYGCSGTDTHTSTLQFTMTATGTLLNFNYVFTSCEFNQGSKYNDIFGLFVSGNGGDFENIALLNSEKHITITNLRAGRDGTQLDSGASTSIGSTGTQYDYFTVSSPDMPNADQNCNGVSSVFTAQKAVSVGDTVTVKFAIADVGDTGYNSYVVIEAGSLSFDAPNSNVDYSSEKLTGLDANQEYAISVDGIIYNINSDADGNISLAGMDLDNKSYDFIGKTISIACKNSKGGSDSDRQEVVVAERPTVPERPTIPGITPSLNVSDVATTEDSIIITPEDGMEYSIDNGATWYKPDAGTGKVKFTGLTKDSGVAILVRVAATGSAPASLPAKGVSVTVQNMIAELIYTVLNYSGTYDGQAHHAAVSDIEDAVISYSTTLTGDYSSTPTQYTEAGTYTDYYQITKDGYYPAYGPVTVTIEKKDITVTADAKSKTYGDADPAFTYAAPGLISGDTLIGGLTRDPGSSVGAYAITLGTLTSASNPNYAITYVGADLTITAKMITPTIILFPTGFAYDGTEKKPAVTVKDGGTVIDPSEYTVAYSNNTNIGDATATITAKADKNYAFTETNKTFTITKQGVTPAAAMANYMYDTTPSAPAVSGNTSGGTSTVYYSTDSTNVDKEWSGITGTTLNVGTYYMKVHVAATENHAEGSSAVITFNAQQERRAHRACGPRCCRDHRESGPSKKAGILNGWHQLGFRPHAEKRRV